MGSGIGPGRCFRCGRPLTGDDVGLYKKLFNRGATEFLCLSCTSAHYGISETRARELIDHFRRSGCALFASPGEADGTGPHR